MGVKNMIQSLQRDIYFSSNEPRGCILFPRDRTVLRQGPVRLSWLFCCGVSSPFVKEPELLSTKNIEYYQWRIANGRGVEAEG